ncbi:MAG: hypothetical protein RJQ14_27385, partial [Marinoscillum sp.]
YYTDKKIDQNGQPVEIVDAMADQLHEAAKRTAEDPVSFLKVKEVFGDLTENQTFINSYVDSVNRFHENPNISVHLE